LPLVEALRDQQIWDAVRSRATEPEHVRIPFDFPPLPPPRPSSFDQSRPSWLQYSIGSRRGVDIDSVTASNTQSTTYLDNCDWPPLDSRPSSGLTRAPTPPPFTVTAESDGGDEHDDADSMQTGYLPYSFRRGEPMSSSSEDETEDYRRLFLEHAAPRRSSPGRIASRDADKEELLQPHATFFMGEHRSKITIKFDPPVSGRFLLLKMFSPQLDDGENIDIQYIAVNGFAGPRFFPSVEMK